MIIISKIYPENKKSTEEKTIKVLKVSKVLLDESIFDQKIKWIEDKITVVNCIVCLPFSQLFRDQGFSETSLRVIERWFTTVANSEDFLELDFTIIATILNSSELLIDSELQVFNAANAWLNHKNIERNKHAHYLLQRVRLSLLTVPALNNILDKNLWTTENYECSEVIMKVIEYKNKLPLNYTNILSRSRHCSQNNFKFVVVGGESKSTLQVVRNAFTIDGNGFSNVNSLPKINYGRSYLKTVCIKGEIYVFGGNDDRYNQVMHIEKYSPATKTWNVIAQMYDDRFYFCACSFIDDVFLIGGYLYGDMNSCVKFSTIQKKWNGISEMKVARQFASCVVFEGRIVVSGGYNNNDRDLNTVEAYDHIDNSWKNMPNMIEERQGHKSVAIKNKFFIISGLLNTSVEVFDSCSNKFVLLKYKSENLRPKYVSDITTFGNRIFLFNNNNGLVFVFDVEKDEWVDKVCDATEHIKYFSCAKIPKH